MTQDNAVLLAETIALTTMLDDQDRGNLTPLLMEVLNKHINITDMRVAWAIKRNCNSHRIPSQSSDIPQS